MSNFTNQWLWAPTMSRNPDPDVDRLCVCGHTALDHHGLDHHPKHGGCHGAGNGITRPKCPCTHTCSSVPVREHQ